RETSVHEDVSLLLPWYVNSTLGEGQRTAVEEHLRNCIVCRRELAIEHKTLDLFRNTSTLDQSVQAGFERLHRRIAERTSPRPRKHQAGAANLAWNRALQTIRSLVGKRLPSALLVASLAVITVSVALTYFAREQPQPNSDNYHTLSSPAVGVVNRDDVQVIFAPGTSLETIEELFQSLPARIIAGPNSTGIYTVRLLNMTADRDRQTAILELRDQPQIIFAEAAMPLPDSNRAEAQPQ
ncbi:MAG TPA: hypothetical protein VIV27_03880, partial [Halioglobus sp.]